MQLDEQGVDTWLQWLDGGAGEEEAGQRQVRVTCNEQDAFGNSGGSSRLTRS